MGFRTRLLSIVYESGRTVIHVHALTINIKPNLPVKSPLFKFAPR